MDAGAVTDSALRRALARARDGKTLDLDEATTLLHARGVAPVSLAVAPGELSAAVVVRVVGAVFASRRAFGPVIGRGQRHGRAKDRERRTNGKCAEA